MVTEIGDFNKEGVCGWGEGGGGFFLSLADACLQQPKLWSNQSEPQGGNYMRRSLFKLYFPWKASAIGANALHMRKWGVPQTSISLLRYIKSLKGVDQLLANYPQYHANSSGLWKENQILDES